MSEDQLRQILAEGKPDWLEENTCSGLSAQQVVELLDTQSFFDLLKLPYPTRRKGVLDRLLQERLVESEGGAYGIRRLGALLLAKRLQDFGDISRKVARVVVYTGTSKLDKKLDQLGTKGYATGFQGLVRFIMGQLPQNEVIEDALRREVKLVPEIAIRKLVANALIHQDFSISGTSMMVEIYADRIEISNPGEPIVPVERFIDGYQSRNERLADLMRRMVPVKGRAPASTRWCMQRKCINFPLRTFGRPIAARSWRSLDRETLRKWIGKIEFAPAISVVP
jgi:predicted HTH transcriptional regulator